MMTNRSGDDDKDPSEAAEQSAAPDAGEDSKSEEDPSEAAEQDVAQGNGGKDTGGQGNAPQPQGQPAGELPNEKATEFDLGAGKRAWRLTPKWAVVFVLVGLVTVLLAMLLVRSLIWAADDLPAPSCPADVLDDKNDGQNGRNSATDDCSKKDVSELPPR